MLSEITEPNGKELIPGVYELNKQMLNQQVISLLTWPRQEKPNKKSIVIWQKLLRNYITNKFRTKQLRTQLGEWEVDQKTSPFLYWRSKTSTLVYKKEGEQFREYEMTTSTRQQANYEKTNILVNLPTDAIPTTIKTADGNLLTTKPTIIQPKRTIRDQRPKSLSDFVLEQPEWTSSLYDAIYYEELAEIKNALQQYKGVITIVSDASHIPDGPATYAFTIATNEKQIIQGTGRARGKCTEMHSFRAEFFEC